MVKGVGRSGQTHKQVPTKSAKKETEDRNMLKATGLTSLAVRGKAYHAETSSMSLKGRVTIGRPNKKVEHAYEKTFAVKKSKRD